MSVCHFLIVNLIVCTIAFCNDIEVNCIVSILFFTIHVSVRLSDRSPCKEEQKKMCQNLFPVGLDFINVMEIQAGN